MSFHIVQSQNVRGRRAHRMRVTARLESHNGNKRVLITMSGDVAAHIGVRPGMFARALIGFGEDQGDFAIEKVTHRRDGYTVNAQFYARSMFFRVRADHFVPLTPGVVHTFDVELVEGRVICRAPAALAQAAE